MGADFIEAGLALGWTREIYFILNKTLWLQSRRAKSHPFIAVKLTDRPACGECQFLWRKLSYNDSTEIPLCNSFYIIRCYFFIFDVPYFTLTAVSFCCLCHNEAIRRQWKDTSCMRLSFLEIMIMSGSEPCTVVIPHALSAINQLSPVSSIVLLL